ncbi:MAG: lipopolysaccharide kinase InaA family protein [Gemmatimonadota bacterium]
MADRCVCAEEELSHDLPAGYDQFRHGSAHVTARSRSSEKLRQLLQTHSTLYDAAAATTGVEPITGRGAAYVIRPESEAWLVRHYRRGGAVAHVSNDRYARFGGDRALHELRVSAAARARGIATPEVIAAIAYRSALFTRFDITVVFIDHARDVAQLLFEERSAGHDEIARAASLIADMIRLGLVHADLNLKNVLVTPTSAYIVDLDRCRLVDAAAPRSATKMKRRFLRSLEKWESQTGKIVADAHRRTLEAAFHV